MRLMSGLMRGGVLVLAMFVAGCASEHHTDYDSSVPAAVSAGWRIADVRVKVADAATVSEAKTLLPRADIVWREDPPGDRKAQVARIVEDALKSGSSGLRGNRPVRLDVVLSRFHALTFEAETRFQNAGIHNLDFTVTAVDARTGEVLAGPTFIRAESPALSGAEMAEARARGESQKLHITAHLRRVIAGWLGIGPDPRGSFRRLGN